MIGRIRERSSFERLRREGTRIRIAPLWCSFVSDPEVTPPLVAFAVGRAVGNAVTRNRLRRRLREIIRVCGAPPGLLLVGADRAATERTFGELRDVMTAIIAEARRRAEP